MITNMPQGEQRIGVRAYADVDQALKGLTLRSRTTGQSSAGATDACQWAMGHTVRSPVTGTDAPGIPGLRLLTAEADASVVQSEDITAPAGSRDYARGAHEVLAWMCGYSDQLA